MCPGWNVADGAAPMVAVIGSGAADAEQRRHAREVGRVIAEAGFTVLCGGLGGVMEAACEGARDDAAHGPEPRTVGVLPGTEPADANGWVDVAIATGIGHARNLIIVHSAVAVVAVGGESGTLSELAHAWQEGRPIGAYLPAAGWAAKLAGTSLDDKRSDSIVPLSDADSLRAWLLRIAPRTKAAG